MENKDLEELKVHISVIRGLINYHKRMVAPLAPTCNEDGECPVLAFEKDLYLDALQKALMFMDSERIYQEELAKVNKESKEQECSIEGAISVLFGLKDRIRNYEYMFPLFPKDYLDKLADAERAGLNKAISVLKAVERITEGSEWLESIRWRIVEYDTNMPYYPDDYKERLIKVDTAAMDSVISVLKSLER